MFKTVSQAKALVEQIVSFSHQADQAQEPLVASQVVQEVLSLVRASLPSTIEIRQHICDDGGIVLANRTHLHQVIINLCANAEYAMREAGGVLEIRVGTVELDNAFTVCHPHLQPGSYVRLTVRDTGVGIAPEVIEHVFEPFFTTKDVGEGSGMGLAIVHGIVTSHGGAITVESRPGEETLFSVYLPSTDCSADQNCHPDEPMPHGKGCILFIDDEELVAELGAPMLEPFGYDVVTRTNSMEALETFRATPERFDLVITDQTMPQMTGEALARELRGIRPDIPIILCTGFSHVMDEEKACALGIDAFLMKPMAAQELAMTIQRVMNKRVSQQISVHDSCHLESSC